MLVLWGAVFACFFAFIKNDALAVTLPLDDAYLSTAAVLYSRIEAASTRNISFVPRYIQYPCHVIRSLKPNHISNEQCKAICVYIYNSPVRGNDYHQIHSSLMLVNFKECVFGEDRI